MTDLTRDSRDPVSRLCVAGLTKTFGTTTVLRDAGFSLAEGEVRALVGGNGSGKSTTIKILAGVLHADPGGRITAATHGWDPHHGSPADAAAAGLSFVHQDLGLVRSLSVTENLLAGRGLPRRAGTIRWSTAHRDAQAILDTLERPIRAHQLLGELRPADQTLVAIARALSQLGLDEPGVLVLDEPTARLAEREAESLLEAIQRRADAGQAVLYVSHRLPEILRIATTVTVLRDGRIAHEGPAADLTDKDLAQAIVGPAAIASKRLAPRRAPASPAPPLLTVRSLAGGQLAGVDLDVRPGEIVGLAGLVGSGRTSVLATCAGARRPLAGSVRVDGRPLAPGDLAAALRAGIAYVPEDRHADAAFPALDVSTNLTAGILEHFRRPLAYRHSLQRRDAAHRAAQHAVRTPSLAAPLAALSGGNQQKVVLGRWLARAPRVLLLDEPTQGVDIGARRDLHDQIRQAADAGAACVVVCSDLDELLELSDRIVVLAGGRTVAERPAGGLDRRWLAEHLFPTATRGTA